MNYSSSLFNYLSYFYFIDVGWFVVNLCKQHGTVNAFLHERGYDNVTNAKLIHLEYC